MSMRKMYGSFINTDVVIVGKFLPREDFGLTGHH